MSTSEYKYIHGDSLKELKKLENEKFKLIMTSPPYNIGKEYESQVDIQEYLNKQSKVIELLVEKLHKNGSICWQVGNFINNKEVFPLDIYYYKIFKDFGLKLRNRIVWHFRHGLHSSNRFSGRYETILWFTKGDDYTFNLDDVRVPSRYPGKKHFKGPKKGQYSSNPKGKNPSDVWDILQQDWDKEIWDIPNVKSNHVEKTSHPCQYPIELVERCVLALTEPGDWILDPYAGVGSTMLAGLKNDRNVVGVEMFKKYINLGEERIQSLKLGELKTRPMTKPIYDHTTSKLSKKPKEFLTSNEDI
ncbi:MAG: adenine-specific DNA-methyltransferase [Bacteroidia bacterium]|jgi:adenine-specific DNA-methyltransferase